MLSKDLHTNLHLLVISDESADIFRNYNWIGMSIYLSYNIKYHV